MLIVHAGHRTDGADRSEPRLPADRVDAVRRAVAALLGSLQPSAVVSAAAAGSDLIVLTETTRLGTPIHVVLPLPVDEFRARSVDDRGDEWRAEFERVIAHATADPHCTIVVRDLGDDPEWYLNGNAVILDVADEIAAEPVVALTIREPRPPGEASATDHFAGLAVERGLVVLTLDPRRPGPDGAIEAAVGVGITIV